MHTSKRHHHAAVIFTAVFITLLALGPRDGVFAEMPAIANHFAAVPAPTIRTSVQIPAAHNGLKGDGRTDNTSAFRALLAGNRSIQIAAGTYVTGKLVILRNTVLFLAPGVVIKDSGKLGPNDRLINILDGNVYIRGNGAKVLSDRRYYSGGEQRHGVFIFGASNVVIDGLESSNNSGDGFYIGGPVGKPAQHIVIENCVANNNRRQGISITSGRDVDVVHCTFSHTQGTAPQFGVDLEPNVSADPLDGIRIIEVRTDENLGGGISIYFRPQYSPPGGVKIAIVDHTSIGEQRPYATFGTGRVGGSVTYSRAH